LSNQSEQNNKFLRTEEAQARRVDHKLMPTFTGTSPNNVMDLWGLEHELRKAIRIMMLISSFESQAEKKFKETECGMEEFTVPAGTDPQRVICNRCYDRMEQKEFRKWKLQNTILEGSTKRKE
jgi:hypothetical protein